MFIVWTTLLTLLFCLWSFAAREFRLSLTGYVLQTLCVAVLYARSAIVSGDSLAWVATAGLVVIRAGVIPWILWRMTPQRLRRERDLRYLFNPSYALVGFVALGLAGLGLGVRMGAAHNSTAILGAAYGVGVAILLIGIASALVSHGPLKQTTSILSADNGVDLVAALTLARVAVVADYAIFVDVAVAAWLFVILAHRLRAGGAETIHELTELKG